MTRNDLTVLFSEDCEMAYGEQAALVGLCELLRPRTTIEIGTYRGGSLALLATRSEHVHTFDLVSHVEERIPNVTYHLGDSGVMLPRVLAQLEAVDLVLVDGDHSRSGVRRDIQAILAAECARQTVIVCHDVANEAVRAGIRDALRGRQVAYVNLSLVPPWERASPLSDVWGGLGLIIVDHSGKLWPGRPRADQNVVWRTAVKQSLLWYLGIPIRSAARTLSYGARPAIRRWRGVRGVRGDL